MIRLIKHSIWLFFLLPISCTFNAPYFEIINECLIIERKMWFQSISIETVNPSNSYFIRRNVGHDGTKKICLNDIPKGYWLISHRDTLANDSLKFVEGQKLKISHSGGCAGSYEVEATIKNGNLISSYSK